MSDLPGIVTAVIVSSLVLIVLTLIISLIVMSTTSDPNTKQKVSYAAGVAFGIAIVLMIGCGIWKFAAERMYG